MKYFVLYKFNTVCETFPAENTGSIGKRNPINQPKLLSNVLVGFTQDPESLQVLVPVISKKV